MSRKQRIEYLICTMCVLITGFIIYGFTGSFQPLVNDNKLQSFILFGCMGGVGFSMLLSDVILTVRFISKRSMKFKVIASLLWFITFACSVYVGILFYVPYQIYNLIKIIKERPIE